MFLLATVRLVFVIGVMLVRLLLFVFLFSENTKPLKPVTSKWNQIYQHQSAILTQEWHKFTWQFHGTFNQRLSSPWKYLDLDCPSSDLYPSTNPAWLNLPGACTPAGIALQVTEVHKLLYPDKVTILERSAELKRSNNPNFAVSLNCEYQGRIQRGAWGAHAPSFFGAKK